jgi:hypothetical protein
MRQISHHPKIRDGIWEPGHAGLKVELRVEETLGSRGHFEMSIPKTSVQDRDPGLEYALRAARAPPHLASFVRSPDQGIGGRIRALALLWQVFSDGRAFWIPKGGFA